MNRLTLAALTGTPGTGKSSISSLLTLGGYTVFNVTDFIDLPEAGSLETGESIEVDTDMLRTRVAGRAGVTGPGLAFISGHLSHFVDCDVAIVLRCEPHVLRKRLDGRGWSSAKVIENVRAEVLDVILVEAAERINEVFEVDTTGRNPGESMAAVLRAAMERPDDLRPGSIDWTGEIEEWF